MDQRIEDKRLENVKKIANAVLYEGYLLYPYGPSAHKNRQRWPFGVLYPCDSTRQPSSMQTDCLLVGSPETEIEVQVRFHHFVSHTLGPSSQSWQEAIEREVRISNLKLSDLCGQP